MKQSRHKHISSPLHSFCRKHLTLRVFEGLINLLYPQQCPGCDKTVGKQDIFCSCCKTTIEPICEPFCPRCFLPYESGVSHLCPECRSNPPPFETAAAVFRYGGALARGVQRLKYGRQIHMGKPLGSLLAHHLAALNPEIIAPVPLEPKRLRARGFNQSYELIKGVREKTAVVIPNLLARKPGGSPQASKSFAERRNLKSSVFKVSKLKQIQDRRLVMVDDVMTTGATARACSAALVAAGAKSVSFLALARTQR